MSQNPFRKLFALAGMLAPVLFVGIFSAEGALRSGYDPMSTYISALSLGSRGWIQMTNFLLLGLLLFLFTLGLSKEFPAGKASRWGVMLFYGLSGLFFISGPFVMDPDGTPANQMTVHGLIHGLAGGIVFLLMPICIFICLRRFHVDARWQSFQRWTLTLGIIEGSGVAVFTLVSKIPAALHACASTMGLLQRIALIPFMVWLFLFGLEMLRKQK